MIGVGVLKTVLWIVLAAAGCADVFNLEHIPTKDGGNGAIIPTQEATTQRDGGGTEERVTHSFSVLPTQPGHALVLVAVIDTSSYAIERVTDNGGNLWAPIVAGDDPTGNEDSRIDVWASTGAESASMLTVDLEKDRDFAATFIEWPVPGPVGGNAISPYTTAGTQTVGPITTSRSTVLIASVAHIGGAPVIDDPSYAMLRTAAIDMISVASWYQVADAGTHEASWTFVTAAPSISALVALAVD